MEKKLPWSGINAHIQHEGGNATLHFPEGRKKGKRKRIEVPGGFFYLEGAIYLLRPRCDWGAANKSHPPGAYMIQIGFSTLNTSFLKKRSLRELKEKTRSQFNKNIKIDKLTMVINNKLFH